MSRHLVRFTDLLEDIFELKKSDLDFGIYRILNIRQGEIRRFLREELPAKVRTIIAPDAEDREKLKAEKAEIEKQAADFGVEVEKTRKAARYAELKYLLAQGADLESLEADVYSHLYNFFNRYYEEGDFVSKRRYREGVYAIPYEGEEVKLYWANHDQYYIKTSENFRDYSFRVEDRTVHFRTVDASTEQNNNKENNGAKRCFMLLRPAKNAEHKTIEVNGDDTELTIRFVYDVPEEKKNYNEENYGSICAAIAKHHKAWLFLTEAAKDRTPPLKKHYDAYVAKNSFDYFIHKDLHGFLTRELDFYIKNEVIHLDDIDTANEKRMGFWLAKARAIKCVGGIIIRFLAQIEEFQKKLWLKKKFIVNTGWCITLDRIPAAFYDEIRKNKAQVREWVDLYAVDGINGSGELGLRAKFTNPPTVEFLEQNQNLVVDTKHFSCEFTERLTASIDNLDEMTDGVLIHGENFQALNLLRERYGEKIDCIHIDPPYNTDTSGFLYKNNYHHSSWMSMMNDKIKCSYNLLSDDGSFICHIDENEYENLWNILQLYPFVNTGTIIWDKRNPMTGGSGIATQHEYIIWRSKSNITISTNTDNTSRMLAKVQELIEKYKGVNDLVRNEYTAWLNTQKEFSGGDLAYRYIENDGRLYQSVSLRAPEFRTDKKFHEPLVHPKTRKPCPVPANGFSRTPDTLRNMIKNNEILFGKNETVQPRQKMYLTNSKNKQLTTVIQDATRGKNDLDKLGLYFSYNHAAGFYGNLLSNLPNRKKSLILDYFAGSGTTGHAVINLNRQDGGSRKYILVEMGEYFNTVTKPRMKKVVYADEWKDGKPLNRTSCVSQIIKYFGMESYEDTLNNITLRDSNYKKSELYGDEYLIRYMLDTEAEGSLFDFENFTRPFDCKLKITEKNETKEKTIDLVETFNYLIGLTVKRQVLSGGFKTVEGSLPSGENVLVVWRNISGSAKEDYKALLEHFKELRKKMDFAGLAKVFVNGDTALAKVRKNTETFDVCLTEAVFKEKMFEV
jgi:adenine-specific DNA-methyltransferase